MAISGKVTASTVAASLTTVVSGILAPHVFWQSVPSDVRGLVEAGVTALITFACGYLAKHGIDAPAVAADFGVPFSSISDATEAVPADPATPAAPVVEALPVALPLP